MQLRRRNWSRKAATAPNAELDEMYERLRRVVAEPAHKAWWHNKRTTPIYASAECCPPATRSPWVPLQGGTVIGKTHEERGKLHLGFYMLNICRATQIHPYFSLFTLYRARSTSLPCCIARLTSVSVILSPLCAKGMPAKVARSCERVLPSKNE